MMYKSIYTSLPTKFLGGRQVNIIEFIITVHGLNEGHIAP